MAGEPRVGSSRVIELRLAIVPEPPPPRSSTSVQSQAGVPAQPRGGSVSRNAAGKLEIAVGLAAVVIAIVAATGGVSTATFVAALVLVALGVTLGAVALRESARLRVTQEQLILTDDLTGLGNRQALLEDLSALDGGIRVLLLLELDGLQRYTQAFGDLAGDALVVRLAERLAQACAALATAYRLGGGRFAVLASPGRAGPAAVMGLAVAAMTERGEGFRIHVLCGEAEIPREASADERALTLADRRLGAQRETNSYSAPSGMRQIMLRRLRAKRGVEASIGCTMGELARRIAEQLGFDEEAAARTVMAAELHDIGKAAIPREILAKPSPLDPHEWLFVQRGSAAAEQIVSVTVPEQEVATIVRAASERYNGAGYPDGLIGAEIPIEARVVAVCAALEAMVSPRPYRPIRSVDEALSELHTGAGRQFDPAVVDVLDDVLHVNVGRPLAPEGAAGGNGAHAG